MATKKIKKKKIVVLIGSLRKSSSNYRMIKKLSELAADLMEVVIFEDLGEFPSFDSTILAKNIPKSIKDFRKQISTSDGVIICSSEYLYSLPKKLKNAIEWCLSTPILTQKSIWHITSKAFDEKTHEDLKKLIAVSQAKITRETNFALRGNLSEEGYVTYTSAVERVKHFVDSL
jgi:chromate reductase, NAD(P)H dehydrogenase (quinone)